ncbi:MAG: hypothetical protein COV73_04495, partial [Candidatus Omnitrophica bacterium CG11_big_fil_rev_8_21_14_0_20_43_6]
MIFIVIGLFLPFAFVIISEKNHFQEEFGSILGRKGIKLIKGTVSVNGEDKVTAAVGRSADADSPYIQVGPFVVIDNNLVPSEMKASLNAEPVALINGALGYANYTVPILAAMLEEKLRFQDVSVEDEGMGNGVLGLIALRLNTRRVTGIDYDSDALHDAYAAFCNPVNSRGVVNKGVFLTEGFRQYRACREDRFVIINSDLDLWFSACFEQRRAICGGANNIILANMGRYYRIHDRLIEYVAREGKGISMAILGGYGCPEGSGFYERSSYATANTLRLSGWDVALVNFKVKLNGAHLPADFFQSVIAFPLHNYPLQIGVKAQRQTEVSFGVEKTITRTEVKNLDLQHPEVFLENHSEVLKQLLKLLEQLLGRAPPELAHWHLIITTNLALTQGMVAAVNLGQRISKDYQENTVFIHPCFFNISPEDLAKEGLTLKQLQLKILYHELISHIVKGLSDEDGAAMRDTEFFASVYFITAEQERLEIHWRSIGSHALLDNITDLLFVIHPLHVLRKKYGQVFQSLHAESLFQALMKFIDIFKQESDKARSINLARKALQPVVIQPLFTASEVIPSIEGLSSRIEDIFVPFKSILDGLIAQFSIKTPEACGGQLSLLKAAEEHILILKRILQAQVVFLRGGKEQDYVDFREVWKEFISRAEKSIGYYPALENIWQQIREVNFKDNFLLQINPILLQRVFGEVIKNAAEINREIGDLQIKFIVNREVDAAGQEWAAITIENNGKPILKKMLDKDPLSSRQLLFILYGTTNGGGVGLSEAYLIITDAGGRIVADNQSNLASVVADGAGARFRIYLPIHKPQSPYDEIIQYLLADHQMVLKTGIGLNIILEYGKWLYLFGKKDIRNYPELTRILITTLELLLTPDEFLKRAFLGIAEPWLTDFYKDPEILSRVAFNLGEMVLENNPGLKENFGVERIIGLSDYWVYRIEGNISSFPYVFVVYLSNGQTGPKVSREFKNMRRLYRLHPAGIMPILAEEELASGRTAAIAPWFGLSQSGEKALELRLMSREWEKAFNPRIYPGVFMGLADLFSRVE